VQHKIKKLAKKLPKKRKTSSPYRRSELDSYQPDNPLTKYVEKVCGVNCTDPDKI